MLLHCPTTAFLIDAGISCRRIRSSLQTLGLSLSQLDALLITHEHSDHIAGLATLLKCSKLSVYSAPATVSFLQKRFPEHASRFFSFSSGQAISLNGCRILLFHTSHDALQSVGYRIDTPDGSVGILTDTGCIPPNAESLLQGVELLVLESNYDPLLLQNGPYPYSLKQRIAGPLGHLSNQDAADFAVKMAQHGTNTILLAHLSQENNQPAFAMQCVQQQLGACRCSASLYVAPRSELSQEFHLCRKSLFYALEN